jgi:hypothetical protein
LERQFATIKDCCDGRFLFAWCDILPAQGANFITFCGSALWLGGGNMEKSNKCDSTHDINSRTSQGAGIQLKNEQFRSVATKKRVFILKDVI